ncbi:MAG: DUF3631 domain-containing protein [Deltaproteobacteria bacterium]|nr:DUF3631 domain-containing protein [Deltaproteobacteria bacterium]
MRKVERLRDEELLDDEVGRLLDPLTEAAPTTSDPIDAAMGRLASLTDKASPQSVEQALRALGGSLGGADVLQREIVRERSITLLKERSIHRSTALVDAAFKIAAPAVVASGQGKALFFDEVEPWPEPVDGAKMLDNLAAVHHRFVVMPDGAADAAALWDLHTYCLNAFDVSPILTFTSPQKRCGKSTALDVHRALAHRTIVAGSITTAALFRIVEAMSPTLLIDEADTFLAEREELRGILNAGHTRSSQVIRTVGDDHEPRAFRVFGAKALAAIGALPSTIEDRSIMIRMARKTARETVERLRRDRIERELESLRRRCARWAADNCERLRESDPTVPSELHDRAADNWRPLLAIADAAGGDWPCRARRAATLLYDGRTSEDDVAVRLLADLEAIFTDECADRLTTDMLLARLTSMADRPWSEWRKGKPLTGASLGRLLRPFGVQSVQIWGDAQNRHGYRLSDLADAFARYLPTNNGDQSARTLEPLSRKGVVGNSHALGSYSSSVSENARSSSGINSSSGLASLESGLGSATAAVDTSSAPRTRGGDGNAAG